VEKQFEEIVENIRADEIAKLTLDLVKIPSPTGNELEACEFYAHFLERAGLEVQLDYVEENRPNVIGKIPGEEKGLNLMLCGHLDTIPPEGCVPPKIEDGRVYGRGSCDMKGSLAAVAQTAKALVLSGTKLKGDLLVVGYVGHEAPTGHGEGPKALAKRISQGGLRVDAAVITEGPMDSVKTVQGGLAIFTVSVAGPEVSVHTTMVPLRSNPILWTAELIKEIQLMDEELNATEWHPLIPQRPCLQLGIVRGGDFYNRLPTYCDLVGTVRWDPDEDFNAVTKRFEARLEKLRQRLRHKYDPLVKFSLNMDLIRDSCEVPREEKIVESAQRAVKRVTGKDADVAGSRPVDDLPIIYKEAGVPTVCYGPALPTDWLAHSDAESVSVKSLEIVSRVYLALALDFCGLA